MKNKKEILKFEKILESRSKKKYITGDEDNN